VSEPRAPRIVRESAADSAVELVARLGLDTPRPVIVLLGGGDGPSAETTPRLRRLFARGVLRPAAQLDAIVIDGGTRAGAPAVMGAAAAELGHASPLLGIAPAALVRTDGGAPDPGRGPLDPNHTHALLTLGEQWGDERDTLMAVAAEIARGKGLVAVVTGGDDLTRQALAEAVRRRWPIVLVEGTGGIADELAALVRPGAAPPPALAAIVNDGALASVALAASPELLAERIRREVEAHVTLRRAWHRFAILDLNAGRQQWTFRWMQGAILVLGLAGAFVAVLKETLLRPLMPGGAALVKPTEPLDRVLAALVLVLAIVVSGAIAARNLFKPGSKWLLLRAAAEAIKREIFHYRTRAGEYRRAGHDALLAQRIEDITRRLARTEVNTAALQEYPGEVPPAGANGDDGYSVLSPDRYVALRLADQLGYYRRQVRRLHRTFVIAQTAILVAGGAGTLFAALNQSGWVAFTTAAVTAITSYLGHRQIEMSLTTYNQTATDLENVIAWWHALPPEAQADPVNVDKLIEHGEKVLESELDGWVQKMQDSLADLRKPDEAAAKAPRTEPPPSAPAS
jgi:hypothetical protein